MNTCRYWEGGTPQLHKDRCSCTWAPSRPHPMFAFIWMFIYILCSHHRWLETLKTYRVLGRLIKKDLPLVMGKMNLRLNAALVHKTFPPNEA
jgi:hypothetical protein